MAEADADDWLPPAPVWLGEAKEGGSSSEAVAVSVCGAPPVHRGSLDDKRMTHVANAARVCGNRDTRQDDRPG